MQKSDLKAMFVHDALTGEHVDLLKEFGAAFYKLAGNIVINTAECPEQMICLRKLQESQQYLYLAVLKSEIEQEQAVEIAQQNG